MKGLCPRAAQWPARVNGFEGAKTEAAVRSPLLLEKIVNTDRILGTAVFGAARAHALDRGPGGMKARKPSEELAPAPLLRLRRSEES